MISLLFCTLPVFAECKVEYEGEAKGLMAVPDDFFASFGEMMPGDRKEETVFIKNKGDSAAEFFFYTKLEQQLQTSIENDDTLRNPNGSFPELLNKVKLRIWLEKGGNRTEIYDGNLAATALQKGISLGNYNSGEEGELKFQMEIPKELGNVYASSNTEVIWVFSVRTDDVSNTTVSKTSEEFIERSLEPSKNSATPILDEKRESSLPVILGVMDYSKLAGILFLVSGSLIGIWFRIRKKK